MENNKNLTEKMEESISVIDVKSNGFKVIVDLNLYDKDAIVKSMYKFSHLYYIHQQTDNNKSNLVNIVFESKDDNAVDENVLKQFCNELIDQQVRFNTNLQFGHIRDLIVEEAFKPVNVKR